MDPSKKWQAIRTVLYYLYGHDYINALMTPAYSTLVDRMTRWGLNEQ